MEPKKNDTVDKIFNDLNNYTNQEYAVVKEIKHYKSLPWEIKDIINRCWEILDSISDAYRERFHVAE